MNESRKDKLTIIMIKITGNDIKTVVEIDMAPRQSYPIGLSCVRHVQVHLCLLLHRQMKQTNKIRTVPA
jgi:hypothetical protein